MHTINLTIAEYDKSSFSFETFVEDYDDGICDGDLDYECLDDDENTIAIKQSNKYI